MINRAEALPDVGLHPLQNGDGALMELARAFKESGLFGLHPLQNGDGALMQSQKEEP